MAETIVPPVHSFDPAIAQKREPSHSSSFRLNGQHKKPDHAWIPHCLVTIVALGLLIVTFITPVTPVELQVDATAVEYTLPADTSIVLQTRVAFLTVSKLARVEPSRVEGLGATRMDEGLLATFEAAPGPGGTTSVNELRLPKGTRVRIAATPVPNRFRVTAICPADTSCAGRAMTVALDGANRISAPVRKIVRSRGGPGLVELHFATDTAVFEFQQVPPARRVTDSSTVLLSDFPTSSVNYVRWSYFPDSAKGYDSVAISTILGGRLLLPKLNDREHVLRPQQTLSMSLQRASIRRLAVGDGRVSLMLTGGVHELSAGPASFERDLMPSVLEILYANDVLKQFLTILAGAVAVALKLIPWLRLSKDSAEARHA